jgi:hypothetical protein
MTTGGGSGGGDAKEQQTGQRGSSFKRIYATSRASTERNLHLVVSGNEIFFFFLRHSIHYCAIVVVISVMIINE